MIDLRTIVGDVIRISHRGKKQSLKTIKEKAGKVLEVAEAADEFVRDIMEDAKNSLDRSAKRQKVVRTAVTPLRKGGKWIQEALRPQDTRLENFPQAFQPNSYSCGAESTFVILKYFRKATSVAQVTKELRTTREGTGIRSMESLLRKRGLSIRRIHSKSLRSIRSAIDRNSPVLVFLDIGDVGHWAVVYGYSDAPEHVWVSDPSIKGGRRVKWDSFKKTWDGTGIVVEG